MHQSLHLLLVDIERNETLVPRHGSRWLLPIVAAPERVRTGSAIANWVSERCRFDARFVGLWLGRYAPPQHAIDWLAVVRARFIDTTGATNDIQPIPLTALLESPPLLPYQGWAVEKALAVTAFPSVPGPFGTMTWLDDVDQWVRSVCGIAADAPLVAIAHRATAYQVVLEYNTPGRRCFFKGLPADRAAEPALVDALTAVAPRSFARTIATARRPDGSVWWLIDACPGQPLAECLTVDTAAHVAAEYARLQQRTVKASRLDAVESLNLCSLVAWATDLLHRSDTESAARVTTILEDACQQVSTAGVPCSWVSTDFDPTNVIVDDRDVRFIDLDACLHGPAPIPIATFARRLARRGLACRADIYDAYAAAWDRPLNLDRDWIAFEIISALIECRLDWERVVTKTLRGEIEGFLEPAQRVVAERLKAAAHSRDGESIT